MTTSTRQTISDYVQANSSYVKAVSADDESIWVSVNLAEPWTQIYTYVAPTAYFIAADPTAVEDGFAPNLVLYVTRTDLVGDLESAMQFAFEDAYRLPNWSTISEDRRPHEGHPSAAIRGTYRLDGRVLYARHRYVLIPHDGYTYLIQATFTTPASADREAADVVDSLQVVHL